MVPKTSLKIYIPIVVITLAGVFTIACTAQTPVAASETAPPTATASQTPTQNATQLYQATLQANQTQNAVQEETRQAFAQSSAGTATSKALTPTPRPAATFTPTSIPTTLPTPTPVLPSDKPDNYLLSEPSAEAILKLLFAAAVQNSENPGCEWFNPENLSGVECWHQSVFANDAESFVKHLDRLVSRSSPIGLGNSLPLYQDLFIQNQLHYPWLLPQTTIKSAFISLVVNYLNESDILLEDRQTLTAPQFKASVQIMNLDGVGAPEWLLKVFFENFDFITWIVLREDQAGYFEFVSFPIKDISAYYAEDEEALIEDVTGDGKDDIVLVSEFYVGGGGNVQYFRIFTFEADSMKLISEVNASYDGFSQFFNSFAWVRESISGLLGLEITWTTMWPWDCQTSEVSTFYWINGRERRTDSGIGEPDTVRCGIGRAVDRINPPAHAMAIRWLESTLAMNKASAELTPDDLIFVYYRLALLYSLADNSDRMKYYLDLIESQAAENGSPFQQNLWDALEPLEFGDRLHPYPLCEAANGLLLPVTAVDARGIIWRFDYDGLQNGFDVPLCDPFGFQLEILNRLKVETISDLNLAILEAGLPLIEIQPVPLSGDKRGWIVVLKELGFDVVSAFNIIEDTAGGVRAFGYLEGVGWEFITAFSTVIEYQSVRKDWNGDGQDELIFIGRDLSPGNRCQESEVSYEIVWISHYIEDNTVTVRGNYCYPEYLLLDVDSLALDLDGNGFSDWAESQLIRSEGPIEYIEYLYPGRIWTISSSVNAYIPVTIEDIFLDLDQRFLNSNNPAEFRPEILDLLDRWSGEKTPFGDHVNAHLRYLLALTYELEGDEIHAVETFYSLWVDYPESLWGQLAAARLKLKP